jgi:hypothetical protein
VNIADDGTFIQAQFIISNIGVGDGKASLRLVIKPRGAGDEYKTVKTFKRDEWKYEKEDRRFFFMGDFHRIDGDKYYIHIGGLEEATSAHLIIEPAVAPFRPGGGRIFFDEKDKTIYDLTIIYPQARFTGEVTYGRKKYKVAGFGTANTSYSTEKPHLQGDRWFRLMALGGETTILSTAFDGAKKGMAQTGWLLIAEKGKIAAYSSALEFDFSKAGEVDEKSRFPYKIPEKTRLKAQLHGGGEAEIIVEKKSLVFRQDILGDMNPLARFIVKQFSKPMSYTMQNEISAEWSSEGETKKVIMPALSELTFINP